MNILSHKIFAFSLFVVLLTSNSLLAQNELPKIEAIAVKYDLDARNVTVNYDLSDQEEQEIEISVQLFGKDQKSVPLNTWKIDGDIGFPVSVGKRKTIRLEYPESLKNIEGYQLKLVANDRYKIDVQQIVDQVDQARLKENLEYLLGDRSHRAKAKAHLKASRDTIANSFAAHGLDVCRQDTNITKGNFQAGVREILGKKPKESSNPEFIFSIENIVATIRGNGESKTFMVGAHYDSVPKSPGADDNASGVAGMLEVARILSQYQFDHNIKFVAFDLEESGLIGSWMYLLENREKVDGLINVDMIGCASDKPNTQSIPEGFEQIYPEECKEIKENEYRGDFLVSTTNEDSEAISGLVVDCASRYIPDFTVYSLAIEKQPKEMHGLSDHLPFWKLGHKAIFVGNGGESRNPFLNSSKDVASLINYEFMADAVKVILATITELAGINHSTALTIELSPQPNKINNEDAK